MNSFITSLCSSLSSPSLWSAFGSIIPILAISVLFSLGFKLIDGVIYMITHPDKDNETLKKDLSGKDEFGWWVEK